MANVSSLEPIIDRVSRDYGSVVEDAGQHPIVKIALELARKLSPKAEAELHRSAWDYALNDDGRVVACCVDNRYFRAVARRFGRTRVIALSTGVIKTIFELNAAFWTDPQFLPTTGTVSLKVKRQYSGVDVPRGLESVAASYVDRSANCLTHQPDWLSAGIKSLDSHRRALLTNSFRAAIEFLWNHELCHVLDGHLDLPKKTGEPVQQFEEIDADDTDSGISSEVLKGAEIHADRFAWKSMTVVDPLASFVGTLVVFLAMCAVRQLRGRSLEGKSHPDVWYRTLCAMNRFGDQSGVSALQQEAVANIESIHPMFGTVLNALTNRHYPIRTAATKIESEALTAFTGAAKDIEKLQFAG